MATFLFPIIALAGTGLLVGIFERHHGPALWVLCPIFLVASWYCARRWFSVASLASYFTAVHLALVALVSFWTYDGRHDEYPLIAMHPCVLVVALLDDRIENWFRHMDWPWYTLLPCYWLALIVNIIWLRRWVIRHFDRLAERTSAETAVSTAPVKEFADSLREGHATNPSS